MAQLPGSAWTCSPLHRHRLGSGSAVDYLAKSGDDAAVFGSAMRSISTNFLAAVVSAYDFSRFQTVVDVGCGIGELLAASPAGEPGRSGRAFRRTRRAGRRPSRPGPGRRDGPLPDGGRRLFYAVPDGGDLYVLSNIVTIRTTRPPSGSCARAGKRWLATGDCSSSNWCCPTGPNRRWPSCSTWRRLRSGMGSPPRPAGTGTCRAFFPGAAGSQQGPRAPCHRAPAGATLPRSTRLGGHHGAPERRANPSRIRRGLASPYPVASSQKRRSAVDLRGPVRLLVCWLMGDVASQAGRGEGGAGERLVMCSPTRSWSSFGGSRRSTGWS